jgi:hypothetical protein
VGCFFWSARGRLLRRAVSLTSVCGVVSAMKLPHLADLLFCFAKNYPEFQSSFSLTIRLRLRNNKIAPSKQKEKYTLGAYSSSLGGVHSPSPTDLGLRNMMFVPFQQPPTAPVKQVAKRTKSACINCKAAKVGCSSERPCLWYVGCAINSISA